METAELFTAIGAALAGISVYAVIKVIRIFLKHIEKADARQDAAQVRQEKFLANHLSSNTAALQATTRAQEKVADRLERVEEVVRVPQSVIVTKPDEVKIG